MSLINELLFEIDKIDEFGTELIKLFVTDEGITAVITLFAIWFVDGTAARVIDIGIEGLLLDDDVDDDEEDATAVGFAPTVIGIVEFELILE